MQVHLYRTYGNRRYWQVEWELNGGSFPTPSNHAVQVVKGGTLAEPNDPTKTGSTFDGWYKETALTNKITFPYSATADLTLYAKWNGETPPTEVTVQGSNLAAKLQWIKDNAARRSK